MEYWSGITMLGLWKAVFVVLDGGLGLLDWDYRAGSLDSCTVTLKIARLLTGTAGTLDICTETLLTAGVWLWSTGLGLLCWDFGKLCLWLLDGGLGLLDWDYRAGCLDSCTVTLKTARLLTGTAGTLDICTETLLTAGVWLWNTGLGLLCWDFGKLCLWLLDGGLGPLDGLQGWDFGQLHCDSEDC